MDKLESALAYAARGLHVFPCVAGGKRPLPGSRGWEDATTDESRIRAWWQENPHYNVAIATGPSGLLVVDVDPAGLPLWSGLLEANPDLSEALRVAPRVDTPRGGFHIYLAGDGPSTVHRLADGVDTRGIGGYVLAPPSVANGGEYAGDLLWLDPPPIPPAFGAKLTALKAPVERTAPILPPEQIAWDAPETIARAATYLQSRVDNDDVAVEGSGGDQRTYEIACRVLEMGVKPETAAKLIADIWNPHCVPPWDTAELQGKVLNAWRYGQETRGGKVEPPLEQQYAHLLPHHEAAPAKSPPLRRLQPIDLFDAHYNAQPLEWMIEDVLPKTGVGLFFGASQTYKTFVMLDLAMSLATGHGPNWWKGQREPQQVLYLIGESPHAFYGKRVGAWLAEHPIPGLFRPGQMLITKGIPPFEDHAQWVQLRDDLRELNFKPVLTVIDTLAYALAGMDENDSGAAGMGMRKMDWWSREFDSFTTAIGHTGKDTGNGIRGSYAWFANADVVFEATRADERQRWVDVYIRKQKEADLPVNPFHFEAVVHGDSIAFRRDWDYFIRKEKEILEGLSGRDSEEWIQVKALTDVLRKGPHTTDHLATTLSQQFKVDMQKVRRKLRELAKGKYRAWVPDGNVWKLPIDVPVDDDEGQF